MSVKERLKAFAKSKERSVRQFEHNCGLTLGYINAIRQSIQPDKIRSIASYYPDLNTAWLMTGEGEMLLENREKTQKADEGSADLRKIIALLEDKVKLLEDKVKLQDDKIDLLTDKSSKLERENNSFRYENVSLKKELSAVAVARTANAG